MTLRVLLLLSVLIALGCVFACAPSGNTNTNANIEIKLDPANMPPGLSGNSFTPDANTPGIPANSNPLPLDKRTKIPGITNNNANASSTPGIPDRETIKRQNENPPTDVNGPVSDTPKGKRKGQ